jgi:hypothetical protein
MEPALTVSHHSAAVGNGDASASAAAKNISDTNNGASKIGSGAVEISESASFVDKDDVQALDIVAKMDLCDDGTIPPLQGSVAAAPSKSAIRASPNTATLSRSERCDNGEADST